MPKKKDSKNIYELETKLQQSVKDFYRIILLLQEQEKKKISMDLHDETGQIVITLGASLNVIEKELKDGNIEKALVLLDENRKQIKEISQRMKAMAVHLRPPALDILGLSAVLREYFSLCTKSQPIKIEFHENIKDIKIAEDIEITLYRIIQEAIYNIIKHSMATNTKVDLMLTEKEAQLVIQDNGKGFDVEKYNRQDDATKMGLRGIKERVTILNGSIFITSTPETGTKLVVILPNTQTGLR